MSHFNPKTAKMKETFRKRFVRAFNASGLTKQEAADYMGVHVNPVRSWLHGNSTIKGGTTEDKVRRFITDVNGGMKKQMDLPLTLPKPNGDVVSLTFTTKMQFDALSNEQLLTLLQETTKELTRRQK